VCGTSDLEIGWGYVKQVEIVGDDRSSRRNGLGLSERPVSIRTGVDRGDVMSQQSVRQAARRSALDAQAVLRKERADRERRLEALAVAVLTALGERDALVRDAERRAGQALRTMTDDEGLSVREAVEWCGGGVTVREITRLLRLGGGHQDDRDGQAAGPAGRGAASHYSAPVREPQSKVMGVPG
jgi:hypothetical protein